MADKVTLRFTGWWSRPDWKERRSL